MFNFKPERVNFDLELGSGASGTVYAYQKDPNDTKWCVKHVITNNSDSAFKCIQEIILGFSCDSPYILSTKGYSLAYDKNRKQWDIFMKIPRMQTSLATIIETYRKKGTPIPEKDLIHYFGSLVKGLHYLHEKGIAHRDLKPANILLDENNNTKIADFGLGDFYEQSTTTMSYALAEKVGTILYAAPENRDSDAKIKRQDLFKADLWSLGVLLFELCTLVNLRSVNASSGKQYEAFFISEAQKIKGEQNKILINLALRLLRNNPSERESLDKILKELEKYGLLKKEVSQAEMRILALEDELKSSKMSILEELEKCGLWKKEVSLAQMRILVLEKELEDSKQTILDLKMRCQGFKDELVKDLYPAIADFFKGAIQLQKAAEKNRKFLGEFLDDGTYESKIDVFKDAAQLQKEAKKNRELLQELLGDGTYESEIEVFKDAAPLQKEAEKNRKFLEDSLIDKEEMRKQNEKIWLSLKELKVFNSKQSESDEPNEL